MKKTFALAAAAFLAACGSDSSAPTQDSFEPNDTFAQATQITVGTPVVAIISSGSDYDYFKFTVPVGGASVRFQTFDQGGTTCDPANGNVDPYVRVYDASMNLAGADDDGGVAPFCEDVLVLLPAGTNYVLVESALIQPPVFAYTLQVTIP